MLILSRLDSVTKHVCKIANRLMDGKVKLHRVLGIVCELFGRAETGTEDGDQSCASLLRKLEALSL